MRRVAFFASLSALLLAVPARADSLLDYNGQCVPFARAASGIQIFGDAWTWWEQAEGKYQRGRNPRVGAVLAFSKSSRLPLGHVAVVSRIVDKRVLMITHANWSRFGGKRGLPEQDVTPFDVSQAGDWSQVKVWYSPIHDIGQRAYPTYGFIYGGAKAVAAEATAAGKAIEARAADTGVSG